MGTYVGSFVPTDSSLHFSAPTTGQTVTIAAYEYNLIVKPAGTLAALTVALPAEPFNGQTGTVQFTQIITALTVDGNGHTVSANAPAAMAAGTSFRFVYRAADDTYYVTL